MRSLPGIATSPNVPPEQINEWPAIVVYPTSGYARPSTHSDGERETMLGQHTIVIEAHFPLKGEVDGWAAFLDAPTNVQRLVFASYVKDELPGVVTLGDYRQGGASAPLQYTMTASEWGGVQTRAYRFTLDVAIEEGIYQ